MQHSLQYMEENNEDRRYVWGLRETAQSQDKGLSWDFQDILFELMLDMVAQQQDELR